MANVVKYNSRIVMKHDITENWDKATNFIPLAGEIIVYTDANKIKVGDGSTNVKTLKFVNEVELGDILIRLGLVEEEIEKIWAAIAELRSQHFADINQLTDQQIVILSELTAHEDTPASATALGHIKIGYTESGNNYPVKLDSGSKAYVNVPWTDTHTNLAGHYDPSTNANSKLEADAAGSTTAASWNSTQLVTGVNLQRDAKGHVTGVSVDSIKMPANPDTNTTYGFQEGTTNGCIKVDPSNADAYEVKVKGINTAAYKADTYFATADSLNALDNKLTTFLGTNTETLTQVKALITAAEESTEIAALVTKIDALIERVAALEAKDHSVSYGTGAPSGGSVGDVYIRI